MIEYKDHVGSGSRVLSGHCFIISHKKIYSNEEIFKKFFQKNTCFPKEKLKKK